MPHTDNKKYMTEINNSQSTGTKNNNQLSDSVNNLPSNIKEWVGSVAIVSTIINLNKIHGFKGEKRGVISEIIAKMLVRDLPPEKFMSALMEGLNIDFNTAKLIAKEINDFLAV